MTNTRTWAALVIAFGFATLSAPGTPASDDMEDVGIVVMLVGDDLELKPVPKHRLQIVESAGVTIETATGFDGRASLRLPVGNYRAVTPQTAHFEGQDHQWDVGFEVKAGQPMVVELSNDNSDATIVEAASDPDHVEMNEGSLYRKYKDSVAKVETERGHGTAFLIHDSGLFLTNFHVVRESDYLAVKLSEARKHHAVIVAEDKGNDLAILWINPATLRDEIPLRLAEDTPEHPPVAVGHRIVAIGSPMATETILTSGIVSKVEEGAIHSDVSINPGSSGGPLLRSNGDVIGVNTFGQGGSQGPGIAGSVRIHLALDIIAEAREAIADREPPAATPLPVESTYRFPAQALRAAALSSSIDQDAYHQDIGKFDLQFVTPLLTATLGVGAERRAVEFRSKRTHRKRRGRTEESEEYVPGKDFYEWQKYAGDYRPVVRIQAIPEIRPTGGSIFAAVLAGAAGATSTPMRYRFKADFDRMELLRGETLVAPIRPGRHAQVVTMSGQQSMDDVGFYGSYEYPPEAFRPTEELTIRVWKQGNPKPIERTLDLFTQRRIWEDFRTYFEALESEVRTASN